MVKGDTDPIDVIAALWKRGLSLRALGEREGISGQALSYALRQPSERAETIIARELKTTPARLWPSRFDASGKRLRLRGLGGWQRRAAQ